MSSKYLMSNFAISTLAAGITNVATTLNVKVGDGALFPNPGAGQSFMAVLFDTLGNKEIIKVTARSGDGFTTIARAQEGTTARAWNTGDGIVASLTNGVFSALSQLDADETSNGNKTNNGTQTNNGSVTNNNDVTQNKRVNKNSADVYPTATGTDTYAVTLGSPIVSLLDGDTVTCYIVNTNATTTPNLNPNAIGAKTIVRPGGGALAVSDLLGLHTFRYKAASNTFEVTNPRQAITAGTAGGSSNDTSVANTAWVVRELHKRVAALVDVQNAASVYKFKLFRMSDGTIKGFGYNANGSLGNGGVDSPWTVAQMAAFLSGLTITKLVIAQQAAYALTSAGTVYAWGYNNHGQLGQGDTTNRTIPTLMASLSGIIDIWANSHQEADQGNTFFALKNNGSLWACGRNGNGQLGVGNTTDQTTPMQVTGTWTGCKVRGDGYNTMILTPAGAVYSMGYNNYGQLCLGNQVQQTSPVLVTDVNLGVVSDIQWSGGNTVTNSDYAAHALFLKSDGTVRACGFNTYGQCGDGTTTSPRTTSVATGLTGVTALVAAGGYYGMSGALKSDGSIRLWGYNNWGNVGDNTTATRTAPYDPSANQAAIASGVSKLAMNGGYSYGGNVLAIKTDGSMYACGDNSQGQLGLGDITDRHTFTAVPFQYTNISVLLAYGWDNSSHYQVLLDDGRVFTAGQNNQYETGVLGGERWSPLIRTFQQVRFT